MTKKTSPHFQSWKHLKDRILPVLALGVFSSILPALATEEGDIYRLDFDLRINLTGTRSQQDPIVMPLYGTTDYLFNPFLPGPEPKLENNETYDDYVTRFRNWVEKGYSQPAYSYFLEEVEYFLKPKAISVAPRYNHQVIFSVVTEDTENHVTKLIAQSYFKYYDGRKIAVENYNLKDLEHINTKNSCEVDEDTLIYEDRTLDHLVNLSYLIKKKREHTRPAFKEGPLKELPGFDIDYIYNSTIGISDENSIGALALKITSELEENVTDGYFNIEKKEPLDTPYLSFLNGKAYLTRCMKLTCARSGDNTGQRYSFSFVQKTNHQLVFKEGCSFYPSFPDGLYLQKSKNELEFVKIAQDFEKINEVKCNISPPLNQSYAEKIISSNEIQAGKDIDNSPFIKDLGLKIVGLE